MQNNVNEIENSCICCGSPGYIPSNCPKCSEKILWDTYSIMSNNMTTRPLDPIRVYGHKGFNFIDTGATTSVVGCILAKLLLNKVVLYSECNLLITLTDGWCTTRGERCSHLAICNGSSTLCIRPRTRC